MGEAPCVTTIPAPRRATASAAHSFRLQRRGRRKLHVVRLGSGGGAGRVQAAARGRGLRLRRWLSRAVWRLAELCVAAALSTNAPRCGAAAPPPPSWAGIEPCFAAPFVPVVALGKKRHAEAQN